MDIATLFPKAVAWAEGQSSLILEKGRVLTPEEIEAARNAGVQHPEQVRICEVSQLPQPEDEGLREAAHSLGLLNPTMIGLTLGHGIYIVKGNETSIPHELRHVYQFEQLGSISNFLTVYIQELLKFGYTHAPLEVDASKYNL
ncbi:MAG TPA: hypothetical protein VGB97_03575 [Candidatus Paceibacterota bacterium]|jgi:hypothetical protein